METVQCAPFDSLNQAGSTQSWTNRFAGLGSSFFTELSPQGLPNPHWVASSDDCAKWLGLPDDWKTRDHALALQVFSGNAQWQGMRPLASVYSGHQFGVWAGQLGDGRALWLGEINTPHGPVELQLKGAGKTPYSRMGDGRAVLRSSIREFLCSEAMHALGIPTTRALCLAGSALPVLRERLETAAVVTRAAESFIRFGHFEHFAHTARRAAPAASDSTGPDPTAEPLRALADFVIDHFYPDCRGSENPYAALLEAVTLKTAELMAGWQSVGFCHGVMNTDNMSILGLTIDYGPFGFLDGFDPGHICNHSDHQGRYAFARQPSVGFWNLHALAQALLPLIGDSDRALAALEPFKSAYPRAFDARMRAKLGLSEAHADAASDRELIDGLLTLMAQDKTDFTIAFRRLAGFGSRPGADNSAVRDLFVDRERFDAWAAAYGQRLRRERDAGGMDSGRENGHDSADSAHTEAAAEADAARAARMNRVNPKFILRNHLAESAIQQAEKSDFTELQALLTVLSKPFDEHPAHAAFADFPPDWAQHIEVSCSS